MRGSERAVGRGRQPGRRSLGTRAPDSTQPGRDRQVRRAVLRPARRCRVPSARHSRRGARCARDHHHRRRLWSRHAEIRSHSTSRARGGSPTSGRRRGSGVRRFRRRHCPGDSDHARSRRFRFHSRSAWCRSRCRGNRDMDRRERNAHGRSAYRPRRPAHRGDSL